MHPGTRYWQQPSFRNQEEEDGKGKGRRSIEQERIQIWSATQSRDLLASSLREGWYFLSIIITTWWSKGSLIIITAHQHTEKRTSCLEGVARNLLHSSKPPLPPPARANHPSFSGRFLCLCLSYLSKLEICWVFVSLKTNLQSSIMRLI